MKKFPDACYALGAAFLFALGLPVAKLLLKGTNPITWSALFMLGSATGLIVILAVKSLFDKSIKSPAYNRKELPLLLTVSVLGSALPPILLMTAMSMVTASSVSLALNLEIVFTSLLAWSVFKEKITVNAVSGFIAILIGGVCLAWGKDTQMSWPLLLVCGACFLWSVENNLLRRITKTEPLKIARFRALFAGCFNLSLSLSLGYQLPAPGIVIGAAVTGLISGGITFVLFVSAIHRLGAARAIAYFSTAPLIGSLLSILILKDPLTINISLAIICMSIGVWLHATEKHEPLVYPL